MKECANCVYYDIRTNNCSNHNKFTVENDCCDDFVDYNRNNYHDNNTSESSKHCKDCNWYNNKAEICTCHCWGMKPDDIICDEFDDKEHRIKLLSQHLYGNTHSSNFDK